MWQIIIFCCRSFIKGFTSFVRSSAAVSFIKLFISEFMCLIFSIVSGSCFRKCASFSVANSLMRLSVGQELGRAYRAIRLQAYADSLKVWVTLLKSGLFRIMLASSRNFEYIVLKALPSVPPISIYRNVLKRHSQSSNPLNCCGHFTTSFAHFCIPVNPMFLIGGFNMLV